MAKSTDGTVLSMYADVKGVSQSLCIDVRRTSCGEGTRVPRLTLDFRNLEAVLDPPHANSVTLGELLRLSEP